MPRNTRLLMVGIRAAEKVYGAENVEWTEDFSLVRIRNFGLPDNFRQRFTGALILIPENYGYGGCLRDIFLDPSLECLDKDGRGYIKLKEHFFKVYPYSSMNSEQKKIFQERNWGYLCLHDLDPHGSITSYLEKVTMYLGNVYKNWQAITAAYRK